MKAEHRGERPSDWRGRFGNDRVMPEKALSALLMPVSKFLLEGEEFTSFVSGKSRSFPGDGGSPAARSESRSSDVRLPQAVGFSIVVSGQEPRLLAMPYTKSAAARRDGGAML